MAEPDLPLLETLRDRARRPRPAPNVANGSGGSDDGGMERRLSAVGGDVREIKLMLGQMQPVLRSIDDRLRKVEVDVGELKGRVAQLPNVWQLLPGGFSLIGFTFLLLRFGLAG